MSEQRLSPEQIERLRDALKPFARMHDVMTELPMRGLDETIYGLHPGTEWECEITRSDLRRAHEALATLPSLLSPPLGWQPIETAPKSRSVWVAYKNRSDKWRTVKACYYVDGQLPMSEAIYDTDDEYAPEGWYEESETHEEIHRVDGEPTHWMELPPPPGPTVQGERPVEADELLKAISEMSDAYRSYQLEPVGTPSEESALIDLVQKVGKVVRASDQTGERPTQSPKTEVAEENARMKDAIAALIREQLYEERDMHKGVAVRFFARMSVLANAAGLWPDDSPIVIEAKALFAPTEQSPDQTEEK